MDNTVNNTLLALLLAVKNLENPLNQEEEATLSTAAQQLSLNPQLWDIIIEPDLMTMVNGNLALAQEFQNIKAKLDNLGTIPLNLIPTTEEVDSVLPVAANQPKSRPVPNINPQDLKSNEITNMALRVMTTSESSTTVKELNGLDKLLNFINQPIS